MAQARAGVACFGEALIDFLARPPTPSVAGGAHASGPPMKTGDAREPSAPPVFLAQPGGAPANVAVGVARLGGDARFIGMLARDLFGDQLLAALQAHGVDVAQVRRTGQAPTALAFVSLDAAGERAFAFYRPPAADLLFRAADFEAAAFERLAVFHACSNSLTDPAIAEATLHGLALAAAHGVLVSVDLNLRPALWPRNVDPLPAAWRALGHAHLVKLSRGELAFLADGGPEEAAIARLFAQATRVLVVTDGAAPVRWWTRAAHGSAPTFPVKAVDTTAAGDAFVAALLWRLVLGGIGVDTLAQAFEAPDLRDDLLRHAAAVGALATTRHGAFDAMPDAAALRTLLDADA